MSLYKHKLYEGCKKWKDILFVGVNICSIHIVLECIHMNNTVIYCDLRLHSMTAQGHVVSTNHSREPMCGDNNIIVLDTWCGLCATASVIFTDRIVNVFLGPFVENSNSFTGVFVREKIDDKEWLLLGG